MAEKLKKIGIDCDIICGYGKKIYAIFLLKLMSYNIIYFQKQYTGIDVKLNKLARVLGKKTVFDIDDAPGGVSLNFTAEEMAIKMMKNSSVVVVGSHKLMDFAKKFNRFTHLIPSSINLNHYKPKRKKKDKDYINLGWIGNGINYKNDLLMLIKPLEKIGEKYEIKLIIVGALGQKEIYESFGKMKKVKIEVIDSIDWADPMAVPAVINDFDIGLYPLLNNAYNQYKCGFKALEYMAMGVPTVVSPVGENKFIVDNEIDGFLVSNEREWTEKISYLVENKEVRKKMGDMARKKIENKYSTEVCADKLINIFKKI
jgi:glycosyltransferase involved in cell wall biosynthesis